MNCHQVLSGACNSGDQCFAVGSVEGIPFTAYAAGCNIVILASNFERVQIIPGAIHGYIRISSLDCSTDTGKIAAAYGAEVCIFEPTPLIHTAGTTHGLEYRWVQTGKLVADGPITALSWNLEGTRLLTGGKILQLWHQASLYQDDSQPSSGVTFQIGGDKEDKPKQPEEEEPGWICVWQCHTATPAHHLAFSPDGVLFATSGMNDRLVKIWHQNKVLVQAHGEHSGTELNYTFIYVAHPRAVTHLSWRKTSKYMPKGSVGNVLVTSCVDNICRVWAETLLPEDEWGGGSAAARSPPRRQRATHRHKHRFMQRLKHMKTCFHIRRNAQSSKQPGAPIPTLPSTYSAHDFHNSFQASSYTGGLHFHLAASINAETDIPLVPSLAGGGRFILHWLHNKEMHFTSQAEAILHDLTKKVLDKEENEEGSGMDHNTHPDGENESSSGNHSHPSLSNTTSINSIATDVTCTHLPDSLDAKIEALLRDWHQSPDLLFSIHPVDGSFLICVESLNCIPVSDQNQPEAVTTPLASVQEEKDENEWPQPDEQKEPQENGHREENNNDMQRRTSVVGDDLGENQDGDVLESAPVISMVTNHTNGTLNLWQLTFDDKSKFSQVLSIGHASRASGHRFRVNDITCHPVLPLLLTTSHHNISDAERGDQRAEDAGAAGGLCSELIMWRVECVGPLANSTLGNLSNSPSACFVASDGESLRLFQAVIDARTLLAEIATSERRHKDTSQHHDTMSLSSVSSAGEPEEGGVPLHERIRIVSQQSTARPGAVIQLHAIADAAHDWHNTQLLHVFQEQLITGERTTTDTDSADSGVEGSDVNTITEAGFEAIVDLRKAAVFNEPFYIVVLERTDGGSTVHMWRLMVSSQADPSDDMTNSMMYVPDSALVQEELLEDTIPLRNVSLPRVGVSVDTQIDLSYLHDTSFMQKKQRLTQVLQTLSSEESRNNRNGEGDSGKSAGLLAVPSFSTLQSLRRSIMENGNTCPLTQKHLVQLDWVSKEDGSHILTVAVGSRVLLFTPVSSDLAQANLKAMKESINNNRPILRKASSLAAPLFVEEIRWMQLRRIDLKTADGLPPLPMQISWVRDGILVVGMDSEMHVYSQWKPENQQLPSGQIQEIEEGGESRALRDSDLRVSAPHLQRVSSINLQLLERDARRRNKAQSDQPQPLLNYMPDYGLFEASQMACPVLPQYHPKQLMELLNSGKIRWVKAILAHLVRCIGGSYANRSSQGDEDSLSRQRGWSRSRTLSVSFAAGAASPLDGVTQITEDVQLDYAELTSVPPLPLWTLLVADKESPHHPSTIQEAKDYNELFEGTMETEDDLDALLLSEEDGVDRRPSMPERQPLSHFGPRQGRILSRLLTHTHLPGLSSLDQMHLLALADTVSTCDADFAERFAANARVDLAHNNAQDFVPDSLDDCGLRFLLAMKHYGYLLRCLPLAQRASLQRDGVGTCNLVWAYHSETHEQLLSLVPGYTKGQPKWSTMRELGVGWWVRGDLLRTCVEKLARASYMAKQEPMDAALYYLAMKKRMLLWGLFRSNRDDRMTAFFANDFTEDRWRKAALKNAFVLLGKQRFEHAAAFFLLGGALKDALEVLITRLGDLQLAMVIARLYESDSTLPPSLQKLLMDEVLGGETEDGEIDLERAHPDPFVRSMALWELRRYGAALDTLLRTAGRLHAANSSDEPVPSVFNFYVYLRTHPRLKRHNLPTQGGTLALLQQEAEEGITRLERRLYFQTAHGHFKAGCPALALEVLSKLPARVRDEKIRQPVSAPSVEETFIHTGQIVDNTPAKKEEENVDWSSSSVDWGAPVSTVKNDDLVLTWDDDNEDKESEGSGASTPPLEMKINKPEEPVENGLDDQKEEAPQVDIMAQQLKFVACLKILMEELSTLATGFEVDGGHLRYQLYIWLEREVEALRRLCGYAAAGGAAGELLCADADPPPLPDRPTLHQLLAREKADFEAKVQRAVRRRKWLKANETLLRTLLSYCSLHGAGGGGLASVRMELVLLLQELGQDKQHQQLLSPLPFPTTLPLLAAAVAANNTVVADPVRHLQCVAHDMLGTVGELCVPGGAATRLLHTLRELAVALSACIYQSLCDSDTFSLKHAHHHDGMIAETPGTSNLLVRPRRYSVEELSVTTTPNKWPGVSALRGLALRAAEEEDSPRLAVLLAEAFCAVYLALLGWPKLVERAEGTSVWSSLREKRALLHMRLLGMGPAAPKHIQEGRPTYREQFVPPQCSILTFLLTKPTQEQDPENNDYDSAESGAEDAEESGSEPEDDDIFDTNTNKSEKRHKGANMEHSEPDSYSWYVMRVAVLRLAQTKLQQFLQLCGIEMSELATTSPMVHGALRRVDQWQQQLTESLEARAPPSDYIPGCFPDQVTAGPPINKYRCLLEKHNTPFNSALYSAAPARRLWSYLVRQEQVQDVFIRAVFSRRRAQSVSSPLNPNAPQMPVGMASQTGRGASVVLKHKIDNIKRMAAHPSQPLYLTGGADGSVQLWEWGHPSCVWSPRAPGAFAKVTRVRFSDYGNKFAAADADGNLAMWQLHPAPPHAHPPAHNAHGQPTAHASPRPFFTHQCHSKGISDFVFLGSCSLVATAGHSSESKNVAIWDTLMPIKKALVVYYYAVGAADGDIKVFSLATHQLLHTFAGEHARSSFFKHIGQGVTQIHIDNCGRMFSCGADGTMKVRKLPERDAPLHQLHQPHY
ncbi:PREDICTED: dmX-like protein 2 [Papilio polytes]|uniref:dmX-like protein 2 n=1 Tax=Papilio polytes TaxID=76194 RepID=UPI0006768891|nr:PREDICTED: dmX-like protein 2 [Papilio polytes]